MPELAGKITINRKTRTVHIDGIEFPWHIAEQGPDVESCAARRGVPIIHIPVFAQDVEIIPVD